MNYKFIRISAYNENPDEENSYHCDVRIDKGTFETLLRNCIEPAFDVVFSKMIPEMPMPICDGDMNPKWIAWNETYYGQS